MILSRNCKNTGSSSRGAVAKESVLQPLMNSPSPKDLIKDSSGPSPRKDSSFSVASSQFARDLLRELSESSLKSRDSPNSAKLCLARSHSGKELCKELSVSPRSHSSKDPGPVLCRSQSGKELVSARRQSGTDVSGSSARPVSLRQLNDAGSHFRPLLSSARRVAVSDRLGLTSSTGTTGSSDKEVSCGF